MQCITDIVNEIWLMLCDNGQSLNCLPCGNRLIIHNVFQQSVNDFIYFVVAVPFCICRN